MSEDYLVLTAVGTDRPGIVAELTALLAERGANVADSRMAVLGGEFALMMLVSAPAARLAEARGDVESAATRLGLELIVKDTRSPAAHRAGRCPSTRCRPTHWTTRGSSTRSPPAFRPSAATWYRWTPPRTRLR